MRKRAGLLSIVAAVTLACTVVSVAQAAGVYRVTKQTAAKWMQGYLTAWETRDADAVVKLFTPGGVYQSIPGVSDQTFVGRRAIHKYWFDVTRPQSMIQDRDGTELIVVTCAHRSVTRARS